MIIWRGAGILVLVIAFGSCILTQLALGGVYTQQGWPKFVALSIGAVIVFFSGRALNRDDRTGHSLFFIPMEYWSVLMIAMGVWMWADQSNSEKATHESSSKSQMQNQSK